MYRIYDVYIHLRYNNGVTLKQLNAIQVFRRVCKFVTYIILYTIQVLCMLYIIYMCMQNETIIPECLHSILLQCNRHYIHSKLEWFYRGLNCVHDVWVWTSANIKSVVCLTNILCKLFEIKMYTSNGLYKKKKSLFCSKQIQRDGIVVLNM